MQFIYVQPKSTQADTVVRVMDCEFPMTLKMLVTA